MPRRTSTGAVLESMVLPALKHGGYETKKQVRIGERLNGRRHFADVVASKGNKKFIVSMKWQQTSGTAEQKVPYEVICLSEAVKKFDYEKAYLVLGGDGWTLRDYFVGGGLNDHINYDGQVVILTLEKFVRLANQGRL